MCLAFSYVRFAFLCPVRLFARLFLVHGFIGYADVVVKRPVSSHVSIDSPHAEGQVKRKIFFLRFPRYLLTHTAYYAFVFFLVYIFTHDDELIPAVPDRNVAFTAVCHNR